MHCVFEELGVAVDTVVGAADDVVEGRFEVSREFLFRRLVGRKRKEEGVVYPVDDFVERDAVFGLKGL